MSTTGILKFQRPAVVLSVKIEIRALDLNTFAAAV